MTVLPAQTGFRDRWLQRRHTAFLVVIVAALAVRPVLGDSGVGPVIFSLTLLMVFLVAMLNVEVDELVGDRELLLAQRRRRRWIGWILAAPAILERVTVLLFPSPRLYLWGSISWLLFFSFATWSQFRNLLKHREVTGETISMAMSIYLLLGLTWGVFYVMLFQFNAAAFNLGPHGSFTTPQGEIQIFPIMVYFSLTTLSTVGFGDITPLSLSARYASVAEAITGQFYLTILVARLVGMRQSRLATPESST